MSKSLDMVFNLVSGIKKFFLLFLNFLGFKIPFSGSGQNPVSVKSFSGHLRSFFSTYRKFSLVIISCCYIQR